MKHRLGYDGICGMIKTRENIEHFRACYSSQLRSYDEMLTAQMDDYLGSVRGHLSELKQVSLLMTLTTHLCNCITPHKHIVSMSIAMVHCQLYMGGGRFPSAIYLIERPKYENSSTLEKRKDQSRGQ